ncbi:unnamed protein product [Trifolium pratense]|uniref:Uncharacterized protein n=1 Tax=Trifolium pratense TaxID=57577 RepID=A0ACB0JEU6_TRIPR|nr:unnamed protein product [Trifolium pratense]
MLQADEKTICLEKVSKKGGIWKDIYGTDEKKVADRVSKDQVDILIELTGHTANNKLGLMACRPAPEPDKNNFNSNVADQQLNKGFPQTLRSNPKTRRATVNCEQLHQPKSLPALHRRSRIADSNYLVGVTGNLSHNQIVGCYKLRKRFFNLRLYNQIVFAPELDGCPCARVQRSIIYISIMDAMSQGN